MRKPIDERADIWALGCMMYLLCYGSLPFTGESQLEVMAGKSTYPQTRDPAFANIISAMLYVEPERRPDVHAVLTEIEKIQASMNAGGGTPVAAHNNIEPRSRSFTLKSDHTSSTSHKLSSLSAHPSLPNVTVLNEAMPNSARRPSANESRPHRPSLDATSQQQHPQRPINNGSSTSLSTQHKKSTMTDG